MTNQSNNSQRCSFAGAVVAKERGDLVLVKIETKAVERDFAIGIDLAQLLHRHTHRQVLWLRLYPVLFHAWDHSYLDYVNISFKVKPNWKVI